MLLHFRLPLTSLAPVNIRTIIIVIIIVSANITIMKIAPVNITIIINRPAADKTKHKIMIMLIIIAPADITIYKTLASAN